MKNLFTKIFAKSDRLSKSELEAYLEKKDLTDAEIYQIEKKLSNNPFNQEAMEGFEENPLAFQDLKKLKKRTVKSTSGFKYLVFVTFVIGIIIVLYTRNKNPKETVQIEQNQSIVETSIEKFSYSNEIALNENLQVPKKEVQIGENKTKETIASKLEEVQRIPKIESKEANIELKPRKLKNLIRSNAPIYYLCDLKVVVYRNRMPSDLTNFSETLEAKYEKEQNSNDKNVFEQVPYINFLYESMDLFSKNKFKASIENYYTILRHYPDDVNANFYLGLCYFNLNKFEKSITYFDTVIQNEINTFYEEAKWYKALSLLKSNKEEAQKLLKEIYEEDGFYAERAKQKLDE